MSDLPPGWEWTTLGEIAETSLGKMLDRGTFTGSNAVPYLRNVNVQWGRFELEDILTIEIPPEQQSFFELRPGDLMVCEGGEIGRCAVWPGSKTYMAFQKALHRVRPYPGVDVRFLRYVLEYYGHTNTLVSYSTGSTIKHLPQQQLRRLPLPLPPQAQQRRIVTALDANLSRLDVGNGLLAEAKQRLHRMSAALRAELLAPDADAAEWEETLIGEISTSIRNGRFVSRPGSTPNGVPILRIGAVRPLQLDLNDLRYSGFTSSELCKSDHLLEAGDILFTRYNGNPIYVGACAVVPPLGGELTYPDKLIRVKVDTTVADPEFVALACSSGKARTQISSLVKTTAGQAGISGRDLKAVRVWLPDLSDQYRIVTEYEERISEIVRMDYNLVQLMEQSAKLHRSLLADALTGQLVPQDTSDEPASALLGRIRRERALRPKTKRARHSPKKTNEHGSLL